MRQYSLRYLLLLVLFAVVFFLLGSIIPMNPSPSEERNNNGSPRYHIQVVLKTKASPPDFWRIVEQGLQLAADEFTLGCEVSGPETESDIAGQIQLVRQAISKKPDALLLAACDYEALAPVCAEAEAAGIRLLTLDSDVNYEGVSSYVGTDNHELGAKMGDLVRQMLPEGKQFGVVAHVETSSTAMQRRDGLFSSIPDAQQRLGGLAYCDSSAETARQQTIEMLNNNPEIACMVGLNESSALGICYAVEQLGLQNNIKIIACDSSEAQIKYLENGTIDAFVIQNPFNMGYLSMQAALQLLEGKKIQPHINTGSFVITLEDMRRPEYQKLLFPFTGNSS